MKILRFPSVAIVMLALFYSLILIALYDTHLASASDFRIYYRGATRVLNGQPLYENLITGDYVGPSLVVQLLAPLVAITNGQIAAYVWLGISLIAAFASTAMIAESLPTYRDRIALWLISLLLLPTFMGLWMGQVSVVLSFSLILAWRSYRHGQRILCGVVLGIAIWTKFFPALLVVYFLWKRDWRVVFAAGGGALLAVVFQVVVSGPQNFIDYYTTILPTLAAEGQPKLAAANHSVLGFAQKTFMLVPNSIPLVESDLLLQITRIGLSGLLIISLFYMTFQREAVIPIPTKQFDLEYALVLNIALLLGSTLGYYGIQPALLCFAVIWNYNRERLHTGLWLVLSMLLINFYLILLLGYLQLGSETRMPWWVMSTPVFGMFILWWWLAMMLRNKRWTT